MEVLINNRKYSYSDVRVMILGRLLVGIKAINYKDNEKHEDARGAGKVSVGYTQGEYKAEASMELLMDEMQALRKKSGPGGSIINIKPFLVTVTYVNEDQVPCKHTFTAKFTNDEGGGDNGSNSALGTKCELFVIGKINWAA